MKPASPTTATGHPPRPARIKTTSRTRLYWSSTLLLALCIVSGGAAELVHFEGNVEGTVVMLGYPMYFLTILGACKVAGGIVILAPRLPRLKEWAYAGIFFDVGGAAASHLLAHDYGAGGFHVWINAVLAALTLMSWALRPSSRRIGAHVLSSPVT